MEYQCWMVFFEIALKGGEIPDFDQRSGAKVPMHLAVLIYRIDTLALLHYIISYRFKQALIRSNEKISDSAQSGSVMNNA